MSALLGRRLVVRGDAGLCHRRPGLLRTARSMVKLRQLPTYCCRDKAQREVSSSSFDVFAVSDLHTDHVENLEWVESIPDDLYQEDLLIVAGDISDDLEILRNTLGLLVKKFKHVAFVPGNHELWVRGTQDDNLTRNGSAADSLEKLQKVLDCCLEVGVLVKPTQLGNLWVVPILSWHHQSFDQEPDIARVPCPSRLTISDYRNCRWPLLGPTKVEHKNDVVARHLDTLNDEDWLRCTAGCDIITFSHFLPHQDLLPEKRYLYYPNVAKVVGSIPLQERLGQIKPNIHVFGHSHFGWDATLSGVRYVQCPLCYPGERAQRARSIVVYSSSKMVPLGGRMPKEYNGPAKNVDWLPARIYSSQGMRSRVAVEHSNDTPRPLHGNMHILHAAWSDHYLESDRDPDNVEWIGRKKRIRDKVKLRNPQRG